MIDPQFIDEATTDYWYDEGFRQSQEALAKFTDSQWENLSTIWKQQSEEWQDRLAYLLGENVREAALLFRMLQEGEIVVSLRAAESLRSAAPEIVKAACLSQAKTLSVPHSVVQECNSTNALLELVLQSRAQP